jgi:hypothetical protein
MGFRETLLTAISAIDAKACASSRHPKCRQLYREAAAEELEAALDQLRTDLARALVQDLTVAELRAGLAFLSDPAVRAETTRAAREDTDLSGPAFDALTARFDATPEGRAFGAAMDKVDINVVGKDFMNGGVERVDARWRRKLEAEPAH